MADHEIKEALLANGWAEHDIDEALAGHAVPIPEGKRPRVASPWRRLFNNILDGLFIGIPSYFLFPDSEFIFLPIFLTYFIFFEGIWQRTLAKFITKTKVVTEDGSKPSFLRILGRTFARFIPFDAISFLFGRGWHDHLSKTLVVPKNYTAQETSQIDPKAKNSASVLLIVLVVFLIIFIVGIFATVVLVSLNSDRSTSRDNLRVANVRVIQSGLDLYYFDHKQYPSQLTELNPIMMEINSKPIPSPVMPVDGDCTEENNQYRYVSTGNSYTLSFCLGETIKEFTKGVNMVKPN